MPAPIDLAKVREARNAPDAAHVYRSVEDGRTTTWFRFSVVFKVDGRKFTADLWAHDHADARRRLAALKATATLDGQVISRRPA